MERLTALVERALQEDIGSGDVTTRRRGGGCARAGPDHAEGAGSDLRARRAEAASRCSTRARAERLVEEGVWREDGGPVLSVEGARARC